MKYAVIAAGEGSRLASEGIASPKPLVKVHGEQLVRRLVRVFMDNGAEEVVIICNDIRPETRDYLESLQREGLDGRRIPLRIVVKTTPSSMHSFFELSRYLTDAPFCLTTVDTIFREDEFRGYIAAFKREVEQGGDGLMGVTDYIDDEKPLYVSTDGQLNITAFLDQGEGGYISGGIYGLTPRAIETLRGCMNRGESRMRNFQRALIADGFRLKAYPFSKVLDIDHAGDIAKAEEFVR